MKTADDLPYTFVNAEHEDQYRRVRAMLDAEIERQHKDYERLMAEFEKYPLYIRQERSAWLKNHFAQCRVPYEKLLGDIVALCPTTTIRH